jgi:hypothetical protein
MELRRGAVVAWAFCFGQLDHPFGLASERHVAERVEWPELIQSGSSWSRILRGPGTDQLLKANLAHHFPRFRIALLQTSLNESAGCAAHLLSS